MVDSQLSLAEKVIKFGCFENILQKCKFSLKGHAFEKSNAIDAVHITCHVVKKSSIAIVVGATEEDLVTMAVVQVQLEQLRDFCFGLVWFVSG